MATTRELNAKLSAVSNIESTLSDISEKAQDAASNFNELGIEASFAGTSMESAEDNAESLSESLDDVLGSAVKAAGALEVVQDRTDEAGDEASEAARDFSKLNASIAAFQGLSLPSSLPDDDISARRTAQIDTDVDTDGSIGSRIRSRVQDLSLSRTAQIDTDTRETGFRDRLRSKAPDLSLSRTVEVDTEVEQDSILGKLRNKVPDLSLSRKVEVDSEVERDSILGKLRSKSPDIDLSFSGIRRAEGETEDLNRDLAKTSTLASAASGALASMGAITLGDRSTLPSPGSGDDDSFNLPSFRDRDRDFDIPSLGGRGRRGSLIPDLPDIDFSRWSRGFGSIGSSAGDAASTVGELGTGLAQVLGIARNVGGLSKIASTLGSIGGLGGAIGGVLSIGAIGTVLAGIVSLVGAIGGLITAIGGLGAALAGLLGVGLFKKGQELAETSEDIEGAMQGIQEYISRFQDEAREALQPIFSLPTGDFLEGFIKGGISSLEDYSTMVEQLFPDIEGMFGRLGDVWSENQPEFFAQLEETIRAFLPMIEGFIGWFIKAAPGALSAMRTMGTKLIPKLARVFGSLGGFIEPLLPSGAALISIIADLVTFFAELLTPVTEILGLGLNPLMMLLAKGMEWLADGAKWASDGLSDLMDGFNKWIDGIWQAMKEISVLEFGKIIWNLTISAFQSLTNAVVKGIQGMLNFVYKMIRKHVPGASEAMDAANAAAQAAGRDKPFPKEVNFGKVDFSGMKADVNTGEGGMQTAASAATQPGSDLQRGKNQDEATPETYIGEMNIDATGSDASPGRIKRFVRQAVDEANRDGRQRTSGGN